MSRRLLKTIVGVFSGENLWGENRYSDIPEKSVYGMLKELSQNGQRLNRSNKCWEDPTPGNDN